MPLGIKTLPLGYWYGCTSIIRALNTADIHARHVCDGNSFIHIAAERNCSNVIKTFYHAGFDLTTPNREGDSPIHIAAARGNVEVIKTLHELGVELTTPSLDGSTPTDIAKRHCHDDTVRALYVFRILAKGGIDASAHITTVLKEHHITMADDHLLLTLLTQKDSACGCKMGITNLYSHEDIIQALEKAERTIPANTQHEHTWKAQFTKNHPSHEYKTR